VTFYVQKQLALGPIRFGVNPRWALAAIDDDPALSTGGSGEFVRRRGEGFFFADNARFAGPSVPAAKSISSTPFLSSLKPDGTPRGYGYLALLAGGTLFFLLGLAVLMRKGAAGWVEIILGLGMIVTPFILTAQRRKQIREQEERERAEREAEEARKRKMLGDYATALERIRTDRSDDALDVLQREREALTLPYEIWGPTARVTALRVGFEELSKRGVAGAADVARSMNRVSAASGLTTEDTFGVLLDLYRVVVWHILADDRLGQAQEAELLALRKGLNIWDRDVPLEAHAADEFRALRGVDRKTIRKIDCGLPLGYGEYCIHQTQSDQGPLVVTNKRLMLRARKPLELEHPKIDEVAVDMDTSTVIIRGGDPKKPLRAKVEDPITTAALIDLASELDVKPKGFA
jgi:hypothetical protein